VFFRDWKQFNYWGRVPEDLMLHGASIHYGNHQSADRVADSARELTERILEIIRQTGCGKVNIIAHSKGGLDCRYAIANLGLAPYVASLTTINSPHRGCEFADYLLAHIPKGIQRRLAQTYNRTLRRLGDPNPDFMGAVRDLTAAACREFDSKTPVPQGIYCQSIGSIMPTARGGRFPMNFSYHLAEHFEGEGDGLVSEASFRWGEKYILLRPVSDRGISHCDIVDMNRENIPGFDVRDFYVELVSDLRKRGL
jgi:triacylglycerol lipase